MISHLDLLARIAAGAVLGGLIGYERSGHQRPAGLRTHLLVAMAASTFMVVSQYFIYFQGYGDQQHFIPIDMSRIASTVVSGIGFIAGGAILRTGATVQGLTTAAGLWLVTAIGLCTGAAMYIEAVSVTALGFFALSFLRRFEDKKDGVLKRRVSMVFDEDISVSQISSYFAQNHIRCSGFDYEKRLDLKKIKVSCDIQISLENGVDQLIEGLERLPGLRRLRVDIAS